MIIQPDLDLELYSNDYFKDLDKDRTLIAMSMRENLCQRNANNVWGNGFKFNSKNEKLIKAFKKLDRNNRLKSLLQYCEFLKNFYGRMVITINKDKGGNIMLNPVNPYFFNQIGKVFVTETVAVIWQRIVVDNLHYFLKSTYTTSKVTNEWFVNDQDSNSMLVYDHWEKIPKEYQVEKVWNHNLGFVPVVEFFNYPFRNLFYNISTFDFLSDWWNSKFLEPLFIDTILNFQKEINFCHSRVIIENMPQQLIQNFQRTGVNKEIKFGDYIFEGDMGGKATAIPGTADFTSYTNALNEIMDLYYKFANCSRFSEGGGAQKTSAEVNQTRSTTAETIKQKITYMEENCTILFAKALAAMGELDYFEDYDFQVEINGNIQRDDTVYLDNIIKQVNLGTMSIEEAIASLRNTDIQVAKSIFESIKSFNEQNDIMTSNTINDIGMDFEGSSPGGGRPEKEGQQNE